jgi:curved DNA-binding protein
MEFRDYYQVMDLPRDASADDIKRAYRRLARKYHPDVSKEADAEDRFKELGEAYEVLRDAEKRAAYDALGKNWKDGQEFRPPPDWQQSFHMGEESFGGGAGFSDFFESLFGGGGRAGAQFHARGQDLRVRIPLTLDEAYEGTTRTLNLAVPEVDASGRVTRRERTLSVKIPAGVAEGQRIRLPAQGGQGVGRGPAGDLYATIELLPHRYFRAVDRDIHLDLSVAPWEAALGATVQVPTLGGRVDLKIPKNAQGDQKLRLKGRGLPGKPPGDQLVTLKIVLPPATTPEGTALYEKMAQTMPFNPRAQLGS